jgi:hypothetical protein
VINKILLYMAILSGLLIVSVYFVGFATDSGAVISGLDALVKSITGRNSAGNFAAYPGGTTQLAGGV